MSLMTAMDIVQNLIAQIGADRIVKKMTVAGLDEIEDGYTNGELAEAAAAYALGSPDLISQVGPRTRNHYQIFPWDTAQFEAHLGRREQLIKCISFAMAELERLDRAEIAKQFAAHSEPIPSFFHNNSGPGGAGGTPSSRDESGSTPYGETVINIADARPKDSPVLHREEEDDPLPIILHTVEDDHDPIFNWEAPRRGYMHHTMQYCRVQTKKFTRGIRRASNNLSSYAFGELGASY